MALLRLFSVLYLYIISKTFPMHAYLAVFRVVTQRSSFLGRSVARRHGTLNNKKFLLGILPNTRLTSVQQLACVASISNRVFARKLGRELPNFDNFLDETDELPCFLFMTLYFSRSASFSLHKT